VANITVGFGALLVLLGVGFFAATGFEHVTALIPAVLGLVLGLLGTLARRDKLRMHMMHAAVLLGLVGCVAGAVMAARDQKVGDLFISGKVMREGKDRTMATVEQLLMAGLCGVFTGLCVKSFIDARHARKMTEATSGRTA